MSSCSFAGYSKCVGCKNLKIKKKWNVVMWCILDFNEQKDTSLSIIILQYT